MTSGGPTSQVIVLPNCFNLNIELLEKVLVSNNVGNKSLNRWWQTVLNRLLLKLYQNYLRRDAIIVNVQGANINAFEGKRKITISRVGNNDEQREA